jgi:type VI secretion system protein ImpM
VPAQTLKTAAADPPGYYGKLPARGDFVSRRLGRDFINAWDEWLQQSIVSSREAIGSQWLDVYLTSPIWRFALAAGCCGPNTVAGVLMPSVDKVGRYFPLMVGCELTETINLLTLTHSQAWYQAIEDLALAALAPDFRLEELEQPIPFEIVAATAANDEIQVALAPGCHIDVDPALWPGELREVQGRAPLGRTRWWTMGSQRVTPCLLVCPGLPRPAAFASLLDGLWGERGWGMVPGEPRSVT